MILYNVPVNELIKVLKDISQYTDLCNVRIEGNPIYFTAIAKKDPSKPSSRLESDTMKKKDTGNEDSKLNIEDLDELI